MLIPLLDAKQESKPELDGSVSALLTFMKNTLGELVLEVRRRLAMHPEAFEGR